MWVNKRMVLIFFLANLFFGLVLMIPFRAALDNFVGHSLMGAKLAGRFDFDFLFEFFKNNNNIVLTFQNMILVFPAVYWLFSLFLSGGAFAVFASGETFSRDVFWSGAARYFGRFFRLAIWSLPVFGILFCLQFIETGFERLIFGSDPYQNIIFWGAWIKFGLRTISILLIGLVLDYGRIHAVLNDEQRMRISLWHGIKFAFGNLPQTFGLTFALFLMGAVVLVIYNPIADRLSAPNAFVIAILFLLQQAYMFFRMMLRLTLFSSQMHLYKGLSEEGETEVVTSPGDLELGGAAA